MHLSLTEARRHKEHPHLKETKFIQREIKFFHFYKLGGHPSHPSHPTGQVRRGKKAATLFKNATNLVALKMPAGCRRSHFEIP